MGRHKKVHEGDHVWVPGPRTEPDAQGNYTLTYECARSSECKATITKNKNTKDD